MKSVFVSAFLLAADVANAKLTMRTLKEKGGSKKTAAPTPSAGANGTPSPTVIVSTVVPVTGPPTDMMGPPKTPTVVPHMDYREHYLVGLLHQPQDDTPEILRGVTSGTYGVQGGPIDYVPNVGYSDIEFYDKNLGEFFCMADNGFGAPSNSADYALNMVHFKLAKPFTYRHGESTFERWTLAERLGAAVFHDPNHLIHWENGADIQVTYNVTDETWDNFREMRVLTGRDFDPEGHASLNSNCSIIGDELMPALFAINPSTGEVKTPFVRTPDIDETGALIPDRFLTTPGDKVHCTADQLEANTCFFADGAVVNASGYRNINDASAGFEGFAILADGSIAAFLEKKIESEPGARVYRVLPGDCTIDNPPMFEKFLGFYPFEIGATSIADVSAMPKSARNVAVIERNGFPSGHFWPAPSQPVNRVCVVDLYDPDENMVLSNKKCVLNYHDISDPFDVDGNGLTKFALTQITPEQLIITDDYCLVAGTDTNWPGTNNFNLNASEVPDWEEVNDARWMVICFVDPIFNPSYPLLD